MRIFSLIIFFLFAIIQASCTLQQQPQSWPQITASTVNFYAPKAEARLVPYFERAHMSYPPQRLALLIFKKERKLELWANDGCRWALIKTYPVLAASGGPGPKLHEGDDQVPEGIYKIASMNPRSHYHLSLDLNYPNNFDREHARRDHRRHLGENIFIHGWAVSIGCIAVGNQAIEELFVLVYKTGISHVQVIIAPNDLRRALPIKGNNKQPRWLPSLYLSLSRILNNFRG
jgi:hypothetical protein